jgi:hypothetical protein
MRLGRELSVNLGNFLRRRYTLSLSEEYLVERDGSHPLALITLIR